MKICTSIRTGTINCMMAFACLIAATATHAAPETIKATVKQIKGSAHYSISKGVWIPLKLHSIVQSGTLIKTAPESTVTLILKQSGGMVVANPNTILRVTKLTANNTGLETVSEAELDLIEGSVSGSQRKNSNLSHLKIDGVPVSSGVSFEKSCNQSLKITSADSIKTTSAQHSINTHYPVTEVAGKSASPEERPTSPHGPPFGLPPGPPPDVPPGPPSGTPPGQGPKK